MLTDSTHSLQCQNASSPTRRKSGANCMPENTGPGTGRIRNGGQEEEGINLYSCYSYTLVSFLITFLLIVLHIESMCIQQCLAVALMYLFFAEILCPEKGEDGGGAADVQPLHEEVHAQEDRWQEAAGPCSPGTTA